MLANVIFVVGLLLTILDVILTFTKEKINIDCLVVPFMLFIGAATARYLGF